MAAFKKRNRAGDTLVRQDEAQLRAELGGMETAERRLLFLLKRIRTGGKALRDQDSLPRGSVGCIAWFGVQAPAMERGRIVEPLTLSSTTPGNSNTLVPWLREVAAMRRAVWGR
jgi:hypothetical protein